MTSDAEQTPPAAPPKPRMSAEDRCADLLTWANRLCLTQGYFPVPFEELARMAQVSKGLVYAYFKTQEALADAMLTACMSSFDRTAFEDACDSGDSARIVATGAGLYFDVVEKHGPIPALLLNDRYLTGKLSSDTLAYIGAARKQAVEALAVDPGLRRRDGGAAIELFLAIVEEAGRAAFRGEMPKARAKQISLDLVAGGLAGLRPATAELGDAGLSL